MNVDQKAALFSALARPSGGFAMVANDGRESLRGMLHKAARSSDDAGLSDFKAAVAEHLGPVCSAMLIDLKYGRVALGTLRRVAPETGRIISVDRFDEPRYGPLAGTSLDRAAMSPERVPDGSHALKFFVFWHSDASNAQGLDEAREFVESCRGLGVLSLLEGVVKLPPTDARFEQALLEAADAFGQSEPDIYKTQVPTLGRGEPAEIERLSRLVTAAVGVPWVALSNGIPADRFADAITAVCSGGASGFLAGRATWSPAIGAEDFGLELATTGSTRLRSFTERVDLHARPWWAAWPRIPAPGSAGQPTATQATEPFPQLGRVDDE